MLFSHVAIELPMKFGHRIDISWMSQTWPYSYLNVGLSFHGPQATIDDSLEYSGKALETSSTRGGSLHYIS